MSKEQSTIQSPAIGEEQIALLERLCNASAVSGNEQEVRAIVLEQVRPYAETRVDALGNVLLTREGSEQLDGGRVRVMLAAHMDEVGFMLSYDDEDGIYRFETIGGLDARQLAGKPVLVGKQHVPGVIGARPIHLSSAEERKNPISLDSLRIDVGPGNGSKVKVGDWATFATRFVRLGPSLRAKALDDRLGVATLIELVKHAPPQIDLLAAFTVQEEVGLRGARVAAFAHDPQAAIVLDSTPANDLPLLAVDRETSLHAPAPENTRYNSRLGAGPAIYTFDRATISDPRLVRLLVAAAEAGGIPYQYRQPGGGGTDAGAIHKARAGIPSVSVSVPARYLHTAASLARLEDWQNTLALVYQALTRLTAETLAG